VPSLSLVKNAQIGIGLDLLTLSTAKFKRQVMMILIIMTKIDACFFIVGITNLFMAVMAEMYVKPRSQNRTDSIGPRQTAVPCS